MVVGIVQFSGEFYIQNWTNSHYYTIHVRTTNEYLSGFVLDYRGYIHKSKVHILNHRGHILNPRGHVFNSRVYRWVVGINMLY